MHDFVLVLNCGSSSIKFALFDSPQGKLARAPLWKGKVDAITGPSPVYVESGAAPTPLALDRAAPYTAALDHILAQMDAWRGARPIGAIGHRVVHGGSRYFRPVRIDSTVLADLRSYVPLAPLHQPFALEAIVDLLAERPEIPQVACFDTAFHHAMPDIERMLPLTWEAWERGIRRFGFHGLSYEYQSIALAQRHGEKARGRTIVAHLGSGASLCAMLDLKSVATTMGFSALDGLMMGTRTGAIDPGVLLYLMESEKLSVEELADLLYHRAGLFGISGVSADPRILLQQEAGNPRTQMALALYVRRIVREIGALAAVLGGVDCLAFTAGVGEHNAVLRERICAPLAFLGVVLDRSANDAHAPVISAPDSRVLVAVEPTDEEWILALHTRNVIQSEPAQSSAAH